ncbi:type I polyketide synthase [Rhodalgimonas zhirmunskyi]|uniref:Phenolphthiocerol/phthiocerol polyketide synthase subunit E n=1 Tax=Rhodalgimonas zhirmunskyi TaxID=2964767 RepID=A0AAJ1U3R1_9RHOB|nr:SDR family NAD(P)-dependent oxidoreductase [Rhodoalgimonas zhirmunskyi]MDQ2093166.1 SDR family NAD(P)-dependent oxidoreductase [Rhodoalgimonas zhirmunskyi]
MTDSVEAFVPGEDDIAIVGMAAHLPGAGSVGQYWENLRDGVASIRRLSHEELRAAGVPEAMLQRPDYVPYAAPLDGFSEFDGEFFGFSPKESAILDPQHRHFLEVAWEAMETAGHVPERFDGPIGVFAGCGMGSYLYFNICSNPDLVENTGMFLLRHTGNDKDFLSTRVSHVFDLKGPSLGLQTACSTSLVAVHYASQALLNGECDMALAGGVTIELPQGQGYIAKEGEILSPDGQCHAFDARAQGTVFGSGAGCVVLRRLEDAIADGDHIHAVIRGSAVNNDGAAKAGYLAPSVDGQAAAIAEAQAIAEVPADTVDYVECHGTGTYLGDPIEVAALTEAFRKTTQDNGFCRIGSVKTNIGHLDTAAGVASLIKATLALEHKEMPPSLGYETPNPAIDFEHSPFVVNDRLTPWERRGHPRRAGVNSLGVGGTNAHVVLEEAPVRAPSDESDWPFQPILVSARSKAALDDNAARLASHLRAHPEEPLADVAWTLKEGRRAFEKRRVLVAESGAQAADLLEENNPRRVYEHEAMDRPDTCFMFPGGGAQYAGMARDLYETEPVFAEWMERGLSVLQPRLDYDLKALWLPEEGAEAKANAALMRPSVQLPLIMMVEYALAKLWISWGVTPDVLIGHSMGENTAACLAGVMSFEDCIGLVHLRGQLFDTVPEGGMLSVSLPAEELRGWLGDDLDLASVNAPGLSVASGPKAALEDLQARLEAADIDCNRVPIDIAAHSRMLEPILTRFGDYLRAIELKAPEIPIISNRTGEVLSDDMAVDPDYWLSHLRGTVLFADGIGTLSARKNRIYIEMGPGKALSSLAAQHAQVSRNQVISALRHPDETVPDDAFFIAQLARIWAMGGEFDWTQIWGAARRNRVVLPTYAFQRKPYFIAPGEGAQVANQPLMRTGSVGDWAYAPAWKPTAADCDVEIETLEGAPDERWLVFADEAGLSAAVVARLRAAGQDVVCVRAGDAFGRDGEGGYILSPERGREGYDALVEDLVARDWKPTKIAHFWLVTDGEGHRPGSSFFHRNQEQGFYALLFLAQAMGAADWGDLDLVAITTGAAEWKGRGPDYPEKLTLRGPIKVIGREMPGVRAVTLDVELPAKRAGKRGDMGALCDLVLEELFATPRDPVAVLRGGRRYAQVFRKAALPEAQGDLIRDEGVYLITGGFGGIGLTLAERLVRDHKARIVLMARRGLPARADWAGYAKRYGAHDPVAQRIAAVERLEAMGGQVMVVGADVSNVEEMRGALEQVQMRFGAVNGVIHAAGVIADAPMLSKQPSEVEDVFTPKIHGTEVLDRLFPDGSLDFMVLFSSSSTVTAPAGQVDYVAANEFLNGFAKARGNAPSGGKTRVLALNWGIWAEVGMAAEALGLGQAEPDRSTRPAGQPLLAEASFDGQGNRVFTRALSTADWVVGEHRTKDGRALLPGTGYIEIAAQALAAQGETGAFEIRDLYFLRPMDVSDEAAREMRVRLTRADAGYEIEVQSARMDAGRKGYETNAQATLSLLPMNDPGAVDLGLIEARCGRVSKAEAGRTLRAPQEAHLQFGAHWRVLTQMALGQGEGIARLRLSEAAREAGYMLPPGLMDLATGWAMGLIEGYHAEHLWVPVSYGAVKVYRPLPERIVSWVRNAGVNRSDGQAASFDVTICDEAGRVCVEVHNFSIRRMEGALFGEERAKLEFEGEAARVLSPAEERLRHNLGQGIKPEEGAEAFLRALETGAAQLVVSSLNLPDLVAQAGEAAAKEDTAQTFQRPDLDQEFVAPEGAIEEGLAKLWSDLLGVEQVGAEDNFFDLGGHSLIAVRLFAQVRKQWKVDFPISVLFEAPTIRACAKMIEAEGVVAESASDAEAPDEGKRAPERRFTHLVPMHQGEGGPRRPFFLVAGMFGNVLNLRHLAHLLGTDRPFYGLQARGLLGDDAPHESIPEAARDYLAEMRAVQPEGPYMLGGFSGGGIIAYEIAQQLKAAGEEVAMLVMLDTPLPQRRPLTGRDRMAIQMQELKAGGFAYPLKWLVRRIAWEVEKRRAKDESVAGNAAVTFHDTAIEQAFLGAVATYELTPWDGPLALFRPPLVGKWEVAPGRWVNSERAYVTNDNDWGPYAPLVEVVEVPGDHDSMVLEPNVRVLAARMKRAIEDAENPGARAARVAALPKRIAAAE